MAGGAGGARAASFALATGPRLLRLSGQGRAKSGPESCATPWLAWVAGLMGWSAPCSVLYKGAHATLARQPRSRALPAPPGAPSVPRSLTDLPWSSLSQHRTTGSFNYGGGNPMRPHRVRLTHSLVENYDLPKMLKVQTGWGSDAGEKGERRMGGTPLCTSYLSPHTSTAKKHDTPNANAHTRTQVHRPTPRTETELEEFHADDYVSFLQRVTPDCQDEFLAQMRRFNLGPVGEADCPVFDGMFEYCALYSGGSVGGAALLNKGGADVCLNWAGGMHHAKKAVASGFCYVNDIVLAILELLKTHARVLYVDIDIHHGDGVEEAFYLTDRCVRFLCVSGDGCGGGERRHTLDDSLKKNTIHPFRPHRTAQGHDRLLPQVRRFFPGNGRPGRRRHGERGRLLRQRPLTRRHGRRVLPLCL